MVSQLFNERPTNSMKSVRKLRKTVHFGKIFYFMKPSWNVIGRNIFIHFIKKSIAQVNCCRTIFFANNLFHRQFFNFFTQPLSIPVFFSSMESSVTKKHCKYDNRIISHKYNVMMSIHLNAYINLAGVLHARAHVCVCVWANMGRIKWQWNERI